jgi:hypothetical protein
MKIKNFNIDDRKIEEITWSRNHVSLLGAFGFISEKEGDFFHVYSDIIFYNKKERSEAYTIHKDDIVDFLQKKGAKIVLGDTNKQKINISFSNH